MVQFNKGFMQSDPNLHPLFFRSWSVAESTHTLICVHGAGGNSADFTQLATFLCQEHVDLGLEVLSFDSPGLGHSKSNDGVPRFQVQFNAISQLILSREGNCVMLCSSGGAIATFLALYDLRNRVGFNSIPVIFSEPALGFDEKTRSFITACHDFYTQSYPDLEQALTAWDKSPEGKTRFDNEQQKRQFVSGRLLEKDGLLVPLATPLPLDRMQNFEVLDGKSPLANSCLALWAAESRMEEKYADKLRSIMPHYTSRTFDHSAHPLSLTCADELDTVAAYLNSVLV